MNTFQLVSVLFTIACLSFACFLFAAASATYRHAAQDPHAQLPRWVRFAHWLTGGRQ